MQKTVLRDVPVELREPVIVRDSKGKFKKGCVPGRYGPGGKKMFVIKDLLIHLAPDAVRLLTDILNSDKETTKIKLEAAKLIFRYTCPLPRSEEDNSTAETMLKLVEALKN